MTTEHPDNGAHARRDDPDTSHMAARSTDAARLRDHVYHLMKQNGGWLTHEQVVNLYDGVADGYDWKPATAAGIRSRVSDLEKDGYVRRDKTPEVRTTNNRLAHRFRAVTDAAERETLRDALAATRRPKKASSTEVESVRNATADALAAAGLDGTTAMLPAEYVVTLLNHIDMLNIETAAQWEDE